MSISLTCPLLTAACAQGKKKNAKKGPKKPQNGAASNATTATSTTTSSSNGHPVAVANGASAAVDALVTSPALSRAKQRVVVKQLLKQADQQVHRSSSVCSGAAGEDHEGRTQLMIVLVRDGSQGLQLGDKRFVLSAKWWERWCQFVDFDNGSGGVRAGAERLADAAPSKINNVPLLHVLPGTALDELMGGPLRPQLRENYHYVLIPQEAWDTLLCWYGGGPTIARFVVEVGDPTLGNAFKMVQVYPVRCGRCGLCVCTVDVGSSESRESSGCSCATPSHSNRNKQRRKQRR